MQKMVEINENPFWTESFGEKSSPAILLVAGAGASAFFWSESFCKKLAEKGFFVIRYDHRDTGLSVTRDFSMMPYIINDLVSDLVGIMDGYQIEKAHIIGHSMGGFIAQFMAAYYPKRVLSITCIASAPAGATQRPPETMSKKERDQMSETWEIMLTNQPTENFEESVPGFLKVWRHFMGEMPLDEEMATAYVKDMYRRSHRKVGPHQEHMAVMQGVAETIGTRPELMESIKTKALIIHGEKDPLLSVERGGKILAEELRGSKLVVLPKMGHMLFNHALEDQLVKIIVDFINTLSKK